MIRSCPECGKNYDVDVTKCPDDGTPTQLAEQEDDLIGQVVDDRFTIKAVLDQGHAWRWRDGRSLQGAPASNGPGYCGQTDPARHVI